MAPWTPLGAGDEPPPGPPGDIPGTPEAVERPSQGSRVRTLEVIRVRLTEDAPRSLVELIYRAGAGAAPPLALTVYRQAGLASDLAIQLLWHRPEDQGRMSTAGLGLAAVLREYGMVDHSVWVEEEGPSSGPS